MVIYGGGAHILSGRTCGAGWIPPLHSIFPTSDCTERLMPRANSSRLSRTFRDSRELQPSDDDTTAARA